MAEVLSPHIQPSSTISMLHSRPSSADAFQGSQQQRNGHAPRSMYNNGQQNTGYRGTAPAVQPYAFQSTPNLRQESRSVSASNTHAAVGGHKPTPSASTSSSGTSSQPSSKDDSLVDSRPLSMINLSSPALDLSFTSFDQTPKASPDRYRRPTQKRNDSINAPPKTPAPQLSLDGAGANEPSKPTSVDDMAVPKTTQSELAKRYRRRSLNQLDTDNLLQTGAGAQRPSSGGASATSTPTTIRPVAVSKAEETPQRLPSSTPPQVDNTSVSDKSATGSANAGTNASQKVAVPPRGSSTEPSKRLAAPSPLSRQATDDAQAAPTQAPPKHKTYAAAAQAAVGQSQPSAAAQQLAAVSDKDLNKGMKSRLRRAFSFGSAQELRRAAGENNQQAVQQTQQTREQHQQQIDEELDAEQLEIARRQEAAGIGAGIYSGQGGFSGSTDNLSISSTASSASMMLRKMGKGAKKSARSIKGLFRPKSVIGVPAADGPISVGESTSVQPSTAQVSMVTVEAERQNVNVNAHVDERQGGGTGFPKLERNSIDITTGLGSDVRGSADGSDSHSRRSIVGSDKDRAEVLAAVKKGILKRSGTSSPSGSPQVRPNDANMGAVPHITESPASSMPSTPKDQPQGRSSSAPNVNGDYFTTRIALTKSMPSTPNGSVRSITFSPRIQFHDAWSSSEYDRRGEIATCNRLTPMLAQQIKEELNTFKMVSLPSEMPMLIYERHRADHDSVHRRWKSTNPASRTRTFSNELSALHSTAHTPRHTIYYEDISRRRRGHRSQATKATARHPSQPRNWPDISLHYIYHASLSSRRFHGALDWFRLLGLGAGIHSLAGTLAKLFAYLCGIWGIAVGFSLPCCRFEI